MDTSSYFYGFDDDLFDFCDSGDYDGDMDDGSLDSPGSTGSDIENHIVYDPQQNHSSVNTNPLHPAFQHDPNLPHYGVLQVNGVGGGNILSLSGNGGHGKPVKKVIQRKAANMRERRRMKSINDAFEALRTCIPSNVQAERRLSKVDTLRLAIRYISYLADIVQTCDDLNSTNNGNQRGQRAQEKVIVKCYVSDLEGLCDDQTVLGHSLSWQDVRLPSQNCKLVAKIWRPEDPTESDLINLASHSSDY